MKFDCTKFVKQEIVNVNNEKIITSFSHNIIDIEKLSKVENKIVIIFRPGDLTAQSEIDSLLHNAKYRNTFYIFLLLNEIAPSNFITYAEVAKFYSIPSYHHFYNKGLPKRKIQKNLIKHFISTNNRIDFARTCLFFYFIRNNLLEKSYFTYLGEERPITFTDCVNGGADFYLNEFDCNGEGKIDIDKIKKMLPLAIDNPIPVLNEGGDWTVDLLFEEYQQSFLSIVVETYCGDNAPFFTEKIWKPIAMKQPFIVMNSKHSLKFLRDLGFKTFDTVIDETYDTLDNPDRWEAIFREIKRISNFSIADIKEKHKQLEDVVEHNYNHFYEVLPKIYETEIKTISKDIDNLIQKHLQLLK